MTPDRRPSLVPAARDPRVDRRKCPWCDIGRHDHCRPVLFWCQCTTGTCLDRLLKEHP